MKNILSTLACALLVVGALAHAQDDLDKAKSDSGSRFLEHGGNGGVNGASGDAVSAGPGGKNANDQVNAASSEVKLDENGVPIPDSAKKKKGKDTIGKAVGAAKGAVYGMVAGAVIGGVVGSLGGPLGTLGGAAGGAKVGAMAGAAIGAAIGWFSSGNSGKSDAIQQHQDQLDEVMKNT